MAILKAEPPAKHALAVQNQEPAISVPSKRIPTLTLARQDIRPAAAAAVILKPEPLARNVLAVQHQELAINVQRNHPVVLEAHRLAQVEVLLVF